VEKFMSAKPRPSESPNATRQMLDELDALMERMLSLPVNDLDQPAPVLPRPIDLPPLGAKLTVVEPAPATTLSSPWPAKSPRESGKVDSGKVLVGRLTAPSYTASIEDNATSSSSENLSPALEGGTEQASDLSPEQVPPPIVRRDAAMVSRPFQRRRSLSNRLLQPLLWINRGYDRCTRVLGPPGRWLRSAQGRTVLGYLGLTLLGVAIAWGLRDWLGWWW
jgi:hypothetical protein